MRFGDQSGFEKDLSHRVRALAATAAGCRGGLLFPYWMRIWRTRKPVPPNAAKRELCDGTLTVLFLRRAVQHDSSPYLAIHARHLREIVSFLPAGQIELCHPCNNPDRLIWLPAPCQETRTQSRALSIPRLAIHGETADSSGCKDRSASGGGDSIRVKSAKEVTQRLIRVANGVNRFAR